ncbi:hypothetical protein OCU04_010402 [Sclerotinia nivalis]|uniref:Uncharacterized protein n=1 Tax=Sclerotinia nivalis TaxID=352851 RepID=A0A9X0DFV1_9HELO|nr:hypothetical protein OCU04_010402 [Sclerotinia nivalis]
MMLLLGVKLGFRKRVWSGLKVIFKDHHEGVKMERGVGYAPICGRGAGGWAVASDGQVITGREVRIDDQATAGRTIRTTGDNRAMFMMGA